MSAMCPTGNDIYTEKKTNGGDLFLVGGVGSWAGCWRTMRVTITGQRYIDGCAYYTYSTGTPSQSCLVLTQVRTVFLLSARAKRLYKAGTTEQNGSITRQMSMD